MEEHPAHIRVILAALSAWWDALVNMAVVNMVWALCWLTLVLGPPATMGLYYVGNRLVHGESLGLRGLLEGGRRYVYQGWLWGLLNFLVAVVIGVNFLFYANFNEVWASLLQALFLILGMAWLIVQFYALPYLMEQKRKHLGVALRNGLLTALAAPGYTLIVAGFAALVIALSLATLAPLLLGGVCLIAVLGNQAVLERLETYRVHERPEP